jgi:BirA family transcriptional regulator, biotin operon repressor / biotin---[acetyl-CoA-carboxylase] ligase
MPQSELRDDLSAEDLRRALGECRIGCQIIVLRETSSTNDFAFQIATSDVPEGLVVFAEHQTAGRGQRSNRWESAARKGLWFSILLRPNIAVAESVRLTKWAAETISETIEKQLPLRATIRLPNDVYINERKIAGVLVEMRVMKGGGYVAIVGIGLNVNQTSEEFPEEMRTRAISLAMATGSPVDRRNLTVALLRNLDQTYREQFQPS